MLTVGVTVGSVLQYSIWFDFTATLWDKYTPIFQMVKLRLLEIKLSKVPQTVK